MIFITEPFYIYTEEDMTDLYEEHMSINKTLELIEQREDAIRLIKALKDKEKSFSKTTLPTEGIRIKKSIHYGQQGNTKSTRTSEAKGGEPK